MPENQTALIPFAEIKQMAIAVASSGLFGMKTPEQALTMMLLAQAEGMHPITAARDYDIIQGRPAKKAEAMLRDFMKAGGKLEWHSLTDTIADATFSHPIGGTVRISWDIARANAAGLGAKDMWKKYPRQMLRSRVVSEGIRTTFPLATAGLYVPEEAHDMEPRAKPPTVNVTQPSGGDKEPPPAALQQDPVYHDEDDLPIDPKPATASPVKPKAEGGPVAPKPDGSPTPGQLARLFAIGAENHWDAEQIRTYLGARWNIGSTKMLTRQQYDQLIQKIETTDYGRAIGEQFQN